MEKQFEKLNITPTKKNEQKGENDMNHVSKTPQQMTIKEVSEYYEENFSNIALIKSINNIRVKNFKSFAMGCFIGPFLNITSVIGPNGGGKSNVIDALCFVLGVPLQQLRSSSFSDLINNRVQQQLSKVLLVENGQLKIDQQNLDVSTITEDKLCICQVAVEFDCYQGQQLTLKRQLNLDLIKYEQNQNLQQSLKCKYFINNQNVSQADYMIILRRNSIQFQTPNFFIPQGDADKLINYTPNEMTAYFENICGSIELKQDYDNLQREFIKIKETIQQNQQELNEVQSKKKKMKQRRLISLQYKNLKEKVQVSKIKSYLYEFLQFDSNIQKKIIELEIANQKLNSFEQEKQRMKEENQKQIEKKNSLMEVLSSLQQDSDHSRSQLQQLKNQKEQLELKIKYDQNALLLNKNLIVSQKQLFESARNQANNFNQQCEQIQQEMKKIEDEEQLFDENKNKWNSANLEEFNNLENKFNMMNQQKVNEMSYLSNQIEQLQFKIKLIEDQKALLDEQLLNVDEEQQLFQQQKLNFEKEIQIQEKNYQKISEEKDDLQNSLNEKSNQIEQIKMRIHKENENYNNLEIKQQKVICQNKYNKLIDTLENSFKSGFIGRLGDLFIGTQQKLNTYLLMAMGNSQSNYLVVNNQENAKQIQNFISSKEEFSQLEINMLILSNLPANLEKKSELDQQIRLRLQQEFADEKPQMIIDLVEYSLQVKNIERLLAYIFSNKVICKNFDQGMRIYKNMKKDVDQIICAEDGIIIQKGIIAMQDMKQLEELSKQKQIHKQSQQQMKEYKEKRDKQILKLENEIKLINIEEVELQFRKKQEDIQLLSNQIRINKQHLKDWELSLEGNQKQMEQKKIEDLQNKQLSIDDLNKQQRELDELLKHKYKLDMELTQLESSVFESFCQKNQIQSIKIIRNYNWDHIKKLVQQKEQLFTQLQILKRKINNLDLQKQNNGIEQLEQEMTEKSRIVQINAEKVQQLEQQISSIKEVQFKMEKDISECQQELVSITVLNEARIEEELQILFSENEDFIEAQEEKGAIINDIYSELMHKNQKYMSIRLEDTFITVPVLDSFSQQYEYGIYSQFSQGLLNEVDFRKNNIREHMTTRRQNESLEVHIDYSLIDQEVQEYLGIESKPKLKKEKQNQQQLQPIEEAQEEQEEEKKSQVSQSSYQKISQMQLPFNYSIEKIRPEWFEAQKNRAEKDYQETKLLFEQHVSSSLYDNEDQEMVNQEITEIDMKIKQKKSEMDQVLLVKQNIEQKLEKVQNERKTILYKFYKKVQELVSNIYRDITQMDIRLDNNEIQSAVAFGTALLYVENQQEPFNGGIFYNPTPPNKRHIYDASQLSGGEKTMAGLALILAISIANEQKFILLDEVDAFLDQQNSQKFIEYVQKECYKQYNIQIVFITHKNIIYQNSQSLIGITYIGKKRTSQAFSLDLRNEADYQAQERSEEHFS